MSSLDVASGRSPGHRCSFRELDDQKRSLMLKQPGSWFYGEDGSALFAYWENEFEVRAKPFMNHDRGSFDVRLLDNLNLLHRRLMLDAVDVRICPPVRAYLAERRPDCALHAYPNHVLVHDPSTPVPEIQCDDHGDVVEVRELREEEARIVNDNWLFATPISLPMLATCIRTAPSSGATVNGVLSCFTVVRDDGSFGALGTVAAMRGRKLAQRTVARLTRLLHAQGRIPHCYVAVDNAASMAVMRSLGYQVRGEVQWLLSVRET